MAEGKPQPCTQPGCDGQFVWARTERRYDSIRDKWQGGKPAPVHWPFPVDRRKHDGTVLPDVESGKVPNVGVRKDQHGMWLARVAIDLDVPGAEPAPGPLSDKMLFPRRGRRRG
jgi:hypothetical protein